MDDKVKDAIETIKQMRLDLREPLELRGTMESAIRSAIYRADEYLRRQAQEAPRDFTVQEFAALPKKFRDHYLRMAAELAARR